MPPNPANQYVTRVKKIEKLEKQMRNYKKSNKIESTDERKTKHDYNEVEGEDTDTNITH